MKNLKALIQVFCKNPIPGEVKTRLIPAVGVDGALALYLEMFERLIDDLEMGGLEYELWISPDIDHEYFDQYDVPRFQQQGKGLGERMKTALDAGLKRAGKVILIGTDLPLIDTRYLKQGLSTLEDNDVVLGPAEDGGYGLVGVKGETTNMFNGVSWGTDQVLNQTCAQLNRLEASYGLLPPVWDVDRPDDIARYYAWLDDSQVNQALGAS